MAQSTQLSTADQQIWALHSLFPRTLSQDFYAMTGTRTRALVMWSRPFLYTGRDLTPTTPSDRQWTSYLPLGQPASTP